MRSWVKDWLNNNEWRLRIGSTLSVFATLVYFLWPGENWELDPKALFALLAAAVSWAYLELRNMAQTRTAHPHDIELLRKVHAHMGQAQINFLRKHDLGGSFRPEAVDFLHDIAENWDGVYWEFHDANLRGPFQNFVEGIRQLGREIASKSDETGSCSITVVPYAERGHFFSEETMNMIDSMNKNASNVADLYERFERVARERLPETYQEREGA